MKTQYYKNGKFDEEEINKGAKRMVSQLGMSFESALSVVRDIANREQRSEDARIKRENEESKMSNSDLARNLGLIF